MNSIGKISKKCTLLANAASRVIHWCPRFRAGTSVGLVCLSVILLQPSVVFAQAPSLLTFLKIDGIPGDSTVKEFRGDIELLGFGAGVENEVAIGGAGSSKPQFYEMSVSKNVDQASPALFVNCATGKLHSSATLTVAKMIDSKPRVIYKIVLSNVTITKVVTQGLSGAGESLKEEVALAFTKIVWTVISYDGSGKATTTSSGYDLATNTKL